MKRILLVLILFLLFGTQVHAQTPATQLEIHTVSPTPLPEVTYTLPYPGLLPNSPLYVIKAARDRLISYFISDPKKKAEFDLLQADKRLQAGLYLLHQEKPDIPLAVTTISKGQNYLHEALSGIERAQQAVNSKDGVSPTGTAPNDVGDLPNKLYAATRKHRELLIKEQKNITEANASDFKLLLKRADDFVMKAQKLQQDK